MITEKRKYMKFIGLKWMGSVYLGRVGLGAGTMPNALVL